MRHLKNLERGINITLPVDSHGYLGRECPAEKCEGYFKIVPGTGLKTVSPSCYCPYCGHMASSDSFHTKEQVEYARSIAMQQVVGAFRKDLKSIFEPKSPGKSIISFKVEGGNRLPPIRHYREKLLETDVECSGCTLKYAVFGAFAFCPDCNQHNSVQILEKNLELSTKLVSLAANAEPDLASRLLENALEDCVSSFDGFGREICRVNAKSSSDQIKAVKLSFQSLDSTTKNILSLFGFNISSAFTEAEWMVLIQGFQKRHVFSHRMGVIDEEYVKKSGDVSAIVGRKVKVTADEIRHISALLSKAARSISASLQKLGEQ